MECARRGYLLRGESLDLFIPDMQVCELAAG